MYKIALVGRPNVGKSTLFNRLVGSKNAIVDNQPGITRDRKYGTGKIADLEFELIDTAGIEDIIKVELNKEMRNQTNQAMIEADIIIFVIDAREGLLPSEKSFANNLRRINKPIILLANKCEGRAGMMGLTESWSLGFDVSIPFSAEHGEGLSDLYDELDEKFKYLKKLHKQEKKLIIQIDKEEISIIRMGIVGRPNTGKSTLLNSMLGTNRVITGVEAGVTRDAIEVPWLYKDQPFCLIDTAGLRRKSKISASLERDMISDTLKTVKYSNICILLIDALIGLEKQDLAIARMIVGEGRGLIIGANMWDKVINKNETKEELFYKLEKSLAQIKGVPVVFLSALNGVGINKLMITAMDVKNRLDIRISTGKLNRWLTPVIENNPPPLYKGRRNRIRYITQVNIRPPTFTLFVSSPEDLPESYARFLTTTIMNDFNLVGLPVRLLLRKGKNPYVES